MASYELDLQRPEKVNPSTRILQIVLFRCWERIQLLLVMKNAALGPNLNFKQFNSTPTISFLKTNFIFMQSMKWRNIELWIVFLLASNFLPHLKPTTNSCGEKLLKLTCLKLKSLRFQLLKNKHELQILWGQMCLHGRKLFMDFGKLKIIFG